MTPMEKLEAALRKALPEVPVCQDVMQTFGSRLPDNYIVIVSVDERPEVYAGDQDEGWTVQLRASWYSRKGNADHGTRMRAAARAAGFMVDSAVTGYDPDTRHHIVHQEFWIESEEE